MLIADPSSTCDVCFENFSCNRECWCIPCGHVFCRECLSRLTQFTCPVCRTSLGNSNFALRPIRKMHVDLSKCESEVSTDGPESRNTRQLRKLEQRIASETLEGRGLTVKGAADLAEQIGEFLRTQLPNEYALLRTIEILLSQLSASMARVYEGTSLSQAVKASYEHRIKQLEQSLKEQTRQLSRGDRSKLRGDTNKYTSHQPTTSFAHLHASYAPKAR